MLINTRKLVRGVQDLLLYAFLIGISLYMIVPFIWMLSSSLKPESEIYHSPPIFFSPNFNLNAYKNLLEQRHILEILGNTVFVATASLPRIS